MYNVLCIYLTWNLKIRTQFYVASIFCNPLSRWTINRVTSHWRISPRIPSQNVSQNGLNKDQSMIPSIQNICSLMFVYGKSWDFYGTYLCLSPTTMVSGVLRQASFFGSTWPPLMHSTLSAQLRTANFKGVAKGEIMDACIQTDRQTHRWTDVHTYMYS